MSLLPYMRKGILEAGCDEAGRGCLAGPVFAAAVIFPKDYTNSLLQDSKKLTETQRTKLRRQIETDALTWAIGVVSHIEIDSTNILQASFLAMHRALDTLVCKPQHILVDGNRFKPYNAIDYTCVVKGDGTYMSIAAASILAKTYRDEHMEQIHNEYPYYNWLQNKGYPTLAHRKAVIEYGLSPYHRKSFNTSIQLQLEF
jgi:ribonuclease HII